MILLLRNPSSKHAIEALNLLQLSVDKRVSPEIKLSIAYFAIAGRLPRTDVGIIADVLLLFKLRNLIMHSGPAPVAMITEEDPNSGLPKLVKEFVSRRIITQPRTRGSWNHYLLTPAVAKWAVSVSSRLRRQLVSVSKNPKIRVRLKQLADFSDEV
jgi:hypothetical protein